MTTSPPSRQRHVWAFVLALCAIAGAATAAVAHLRPLAEAPIALPFLLVVAIVAAAEWCSFEIQYRTDSQTFTLAEFPIVLGVLFLQPMPFLVAQLIGLAIPFAIRRSTPVRAVFNLANATIAGVLTIAITRGLAGPDPSPDEVRLWLAVLVGVAVEAPLSSLLVIVARSVAEGQLLLRDAPRLAVFAMVNGLAIGCVGVLVAVMSQTLPPLAVLALVPAAMSYSASRLYVREQRSRSNVEFLYEATKAIHRTADVDTALTDLLEVTRTVFRAERALLAIARPDNGAWLTFEVGVPHAGFDEPFAPAWLPDTDEPRIITTSGHEQQRALLRNVGASHAMVRRLQVGPGVSGLLIVADRKGGVHTFGKAEKYLFDLLANQVAVGLENSHLERSLSHLTELEEELRHQANHDALTGLANRALLSAALDGTGPNADAPRAIVLVDLDDFKTINDSLGHGVGDAVLIEVARRLRRCVRSEDLVARLGGDEFAILLSTVGSADGVQAASESARRIADALEPPMRLGEHDLVVRGSVGVAHVEPGVPLSDVLRNADVAMYVAKKSGKGTSRLFEPSMVAAAHERLQLISGLRSAIARNELALQYQPIVDLASERTVAVEALLRWQHPVLGAIPPDRFIPTAEESGLIVEIGRWTLERACREIGDLHDDVDLSVNVAVRQLLEPSFTDMLRGILEEAGFSAQRLILEITERTALAESPTVLAAVESLRALGVRLALDDFGTGYSSLAVVHRFPLDLIKIDKLFIASQDLSLARAIVAMAHELGLAAVAEGIEERHQMVAMREIGCELGQGFAFARPMTPEQLANLLRAGTVARTLA